MYHESEPVELDVLTDPVEVQCVSGLIQYPDAADPRSRNVSAWSWVVTSVGMRQPSDVIAYADMLADYADRLRELAAELAAAQTPRPVGGRAGQILLDDREQKRSDRDPGQRPDRGREQSTSTNHMLLRLHPSPPAPLLT